MRGLDVLHDFQLFHLLAVLHEEDLRLFEVIKHEVVFGFQTKHVQEDLRCLLNVESLLKLELLLLEVQTSQTDKGDLDLAVLASSQDHAL